MALPLPKVVSDVGPGGRFFTNYNAITKANLENRKQELENQYYGPKAYAQAQSQLAYSQTAFPDAIAKFLTSPAATQMSSDEQKALNKTFQGYVNNIPNNANVFQQMMQQNNGRNNGLMGLIADAIGGNTQGQPNMMSQPMTPGKQAFNQIQQNPALAQQYADNGQVTIPDQEPPVMGRHPALNNDGIGPATPSGQQAANMVMPGTQGGNNQNTASKVQEAAAQAAATGQTESEVKAMAATQANAENLSGIAPQLEKITDGFESNVNQSYYTGARLGESKVAGYGAAPTLLGNDLSAEQLADSYAQQGANLVANWMNSGGGHVNDSLREQAQQIKFNRALDPKARQTIIDQTRAFTERGAEYGDFVPFIRRQNPNITSSELNQLFNKYQHYVPNFDYKNNKRMPENDELWRVFASPEALAVYRATGSFHPTKVKHLKNGQIAFQLNGETYVE